MILMTHGHGYLLLSWHFSTVIAFMPRLTPTDFTRYILVNILGI